MYTKTFFFKKKKKYFTYLPTHQQKGWVVKGETNNLLALASVFEIRIFYSLARSLYF